MDISLTGGGEPWAKAAAGMILPYSAGNGVDLQSTVQKAKVLSQIIREQGTYKNKHTKEDTTPMYVWSAIIYNFYQQLPGLLAFAVFIPATQWDQEMGQMLF